MRSLALQFQATLKTEECCTCGIIFAMPEDFQNRRAKKHDSFYCPAGHKQYYSGETEEERLKRELEEANRKAARLSSEIMSERTRRGIAEKKTEKLLKRARAGVCPHCHRTFPQIAQHMKTKHPEELKK